MQIIITKQYELYTKNTREKERVIVEYEKAHKNSDVQQRKN